MRGHPLCDQAHATLCRLADAPPAAQAAKAAIAELERAWERPFAVGIGGEVPARTELFNRACDDNVLDPFGRALGSAAVRIKRGNPAGFRAVRDDGTTQEQARPPDRTKEIATARARATAARGELAERENALVRVEATLTRPPWWAIWRWIVFWIATWRARRKTDRKLAELAISESRTQLEQLETDATALEAHARLAKQRYYDGLRTVAGGGPSGAGVVEVTIVVEASPLPENIELVELAGASRASAEVDAVLLAHGSAVFAPVRDGAPLSLGDHAELFAALPALLADARALRLAHRVERKIKSVMASLTEAIERKEATFRERIDRLQAKRVEDPSAFVRERLQRVRSEISSTITAVVEHASVHLGSELAELQDKWIGALAASTDSKSLDAAIAEIEAEWDVRPRRIAEEVRVLVMGGLGGSARDIYPMVTEPLRAHGLPEEHATLRAAPELPAVTLLPSLTKDARKLEKAGWLSGLFRSFEARRNATREKVHERVEHMREIAGSELLDAEPRLHEAISTALANLLEVAIGQQQAWLDRTLDKERAQIAQDRESITPLIAVRDAVRAESARLTDMIAQLERHQPAIAVAAAAAETASLSR